MSELPIEIQVIKKKDQVKIENNVGGGGGREVATELSFMTNFPVSSVFSLLDRVEFDSDVCQCNIVRILSKPLRVVTTNSLFA